MNYRISFFQYKQLVAEELTLIGGGGPVEDRENQKVWMHYRAKWPAVSAAAIVKGDRMAAARRAAGEAE